MNKFFNWNSKILLFPLFILILSSLTFAQDEISVSLFDKLHQPVTNTNVFISFLDEYNNIFETNEYMIVENNVLISVPEDTNAISFVALINNESDALYGFSEKTEEELTITMFPFATIKGVVFDSKDNLIEGATLMCSCNLFSKNDCPEKSDEFGSFEILAVKDGNCKVFARQGSERGYTSLIVKEGQVYDVEVKLNEAEGMNPKYLLLIIIVLMFLVILTLFIIRQYRLGIKRLKDMEESVFKEKKQVEVQKEKVEDVEEKAEAIVKEEKEEYIKITDRMKDIISMLDDNEEEVVNYLLENKGHSSQSKIRYATNTPKTTLFRVIQRLEGKKIVRTETVGKLKKVFLTDFFMSGSENNK